MRSTSFLIALALLIFFWSFGWAQEPPRPPNPEPVFDALQKDITLIYHPQFPIGREAIADILRSKEFAAETIRELIGARPQLSKTNDRGAVLGTGFGGGVVEGWATEKSNKAYFIYVSERHRIVRRETPGSVPLRLTIAGRGGVGDSELEKYAQLVIKHLNQVLADVSRRAMEQELAQLNSDAQQAQKTAELARQKLNETRDSIRRASGDFSEPTMQELVTSLKKQEQALQVELAGMKGRAAAIQQEVAKTAERAKKDSADDEIVKNLMRVIDLRVQQLRYLKELGETGAITQAEAAKGEEQVALAKIELAQAKRANSRPASDQLDKLNTELAQIAVSMAESEAKLKYVVEQLGLYEHLLQDLVDAKPLREQLDKQTSALITLQAQADHAATEVRQLESSFRPARVEAFELRTGDDKAGETEKREKK